MLKRAVVSVVFIVLSQQAWAGPLRLVLESNDDRGAGSEVFAASFATFDDFINSPPGAPGSFSGINISSTFDVAGFAYDGMYRLLLESNDDRGAGSEVFAASFATFDDFINSPPGAPGSFSGINISSTFDVVGFAYDGMYRLLLESNDDRGAGSEVFAASFATFDDFINSPPGAPGSFSGINISSTFDVVGFSHEFVATPVPEPNTLALSFFGLIFLLIRRRHS